MYLISSDIVFPDVALADEDPNGLLAIGGDLSVERLLLAYKSGIFPWYSAGEPILWWSPNPRSILTPTEVKISRSLKKTIRNGDFSITFDQDFLSVINACSKARDGDPRTWINSEMMDAYAKLHQHGYAHSVECWLDNKLVGGLYGVALDRVFFGESMFSLYSNASKTAFIYLVIHLQKWGYKLIDCQIQTDHLDSFGAHNIERHDFVKMLRTNCKQISPQKPWESDIVLCKLLD